MSTLYKGKYLIAIYDKNDYLVDVSGNPSTLKCFKNSSVARSVISKVFNGERKNESIHFIDVFEKHDDIFSDEDKVFLEFVEMEKTSKNTVASFCRENNISERTFYRKNSIQKGMEL